MSLLKFKDAIKARAVKVQEMEKNFEDARRIAAYREASKGVIIGDYRRAIQEAISGLKTEQQGIRDKYVNSRPPLQEQAQRATLDVLKFRAMTVPQLKQQMKENQSLPPALIDPVEIRCLGAELRSRGDGDAADSLSEWAYASSIDQPWISDPQFKDLQSRVERFKVYDLQAAEGVIITSVDQTIGKDDVIRIDAPVPIGREG